MKILFVGDVFGKVGRKVARHVLPRIVDRESVDLTIANVENVSKGIGVSREALEDLKGVGVQVMTSGNHIWRRHGKDDCLGEEPCLLRPANYPSDAPGKGSLIWESPLGQKVGILNLLGRIFMEPLDCPFRKAEEEVARLLGLGVRMIVIDFHAEATSEKAAMAWFLDGRVSAVVGTHTHVQTADERILPGKSGFITDAGMTGPHDSVIGVKVEPSVKRFLTGVPQRLEPATKNAVLHGVVMELCAESGQCKDIRRVREPLDT